jgi:hypothetical protein
MPIAWHNPRFATYRPGRVPRSLRGTCRPLPVLVPAAEVVAADVEPQVAGEGEKALHGVAVESGAPRPRRRLRGPSGRPGRAPGNPRHSARRRGPARRAVDSPRRPGGQRILCPHPTLTRSSSSTDRTATPRDVTGIRRSSRRIKLITRADRRLRAAAGEELSTGVRLVTV